MQLTKSRSNQYRIGIRIPYRIFCHHCLQVTHFGIYELVYLSLVRILSRCSSRRRRSFGCSCFCRGCVGCLPSCSHHLVRNLLRCLQTRNSGRRLQSIDNSLRIGAGYSRGRRLLAGPVAEPVTNVSAEITCTQSNTKGCKKSCKPVLSCSGKEARQSIGTEASSRTEQDVLDYIRIYLRLLIQAHHLEICLFIHVYLT